MERLEEGVFQVIAEEREERALRKAEMEAQKVGEVARAVAEA